MTDSQRHLLGNDSTFNIGGSEHNESDTENNNTHMLPRPGPLVESFDDECKRHEIDMDKLDGKIFNIKCVNGEKDFVSLLNSEVKKCNDFYVRACKELHMRNYPTKDEKDPEVKPLLLTKDILKLEAFVKRNQQTLIEITELHDERSKQHLASSYQWKIQRHGFCSQECLQPLLLLLSQRYEALREADEQKQRKAKEKKEGEPAKGVSTTNFERTSIKFWIRNNDVIAAICMMVRHLPIYSHGDKTKLSEKITSIYYDESNLGMYATRLVKEEGSSLIRFRWYGELEQAQHVFVERKVHHEKWVLENSAKTRCMIPKEEVLDFVQGKYQVDASYLEKNPVFLEVQQAVVNDSLRPALQTLYHRRAFQRADDDSVRLSLDTELMMLRENSPHRQVNLDVAWRRDPDSFLESDVHRFPFAVLEVKLHTHLLYNPPAWVEELMNSELLIRVDKFSKYCHGIAVLYSDMVTSLPYWLDDDFTQEFMNDLEPDSDHGPARRMAGRRDNRSISIQRNSRSIYEQATRSLMVQPPPLAISRAGTEGAGGSCPKLSSCLSCCRKPEKKKSKVQKRLRIEPKTFFANERTYLQWFNAATLIGSVAIAMMGLSDTSRLIGQYIFLPFCFLTIAYALTMYHWRTQKLMNRDPSASYSDRMGPTILTFVFLAAMLSSAVVSGTFESLEPLEGHVELMQRMMVQCDVSYGFPLAPQKQFEPSAVVNIGGSNDRLLVGNDDGRILKLDLLRSKSDGSVNALWGPPVGPVGIAALASDIPTGTGFGANTARESSLVYAVGNSPPSVFQVDVDTQAVHRQWAMRDYLVNALGVADPALTLTALAVYPTANKALPTFFAAAGAGVFVLQTGESGSLDVKHTFYPLGSSHTSPIAALALYHDQLFVHIDSTTLLYPINTTTSLPTALASVYSFAVPVRDYVFVAPRPPPVATGRTVQTEEDSERPGNGLHLSKWNVAAADASTEGSKASVFVAGGQQVVQVTWERDAGFSFCK